MDARTALRRLLSQRLEAGETTIVLETMQAAEVVAPRAPNVILSQAKESPRKAEANSFAPLGMTETGSSDWRTALQESGAESLAKRTATVSAADKPPAKQGKVVVTPDTPLPPMNSLGDIAALVKSCTRCPLYATAINPVPGEGNPNADFMVVGEAPGATEDETGKPFVGRAGQLLTQILEAIQLKREDVFICNVLKHRPPGNRNPEPDEVKACSPYLIRQIELIRPKVILARGTFSAQTLLNTKTAIGKLRGQVHEYHGVPVVVTYHPAALLRNPAWKRPTWEDVQLARRILDSAPPRS